MIDIPSISALVAAVGVIVGVVFTVLELRNLVKTRQTDLVIRLYSTFGGKEFLETWERTMAVEYKDYDDFVKKYGMASTLQVGLFFEGIGVLLKRKLIDISLVDDLFATPVKSTWEKLKTATEDGRKQRDEPRIFEWFEYLYSELQKREQAPQA